jgi:hypothetical protein
VLGRGERGVCKNERIVLIHLIGGIENNETRELEMEKYNRVINFYETEEEKK